MSAQAGFEVVFRGLFSVIVMLDIVSKWLIVVNRQVTASPFASLFSSPFCVLVTSYKTTSGNNFKIVCT